MTEWKQVRDSRQERPEELDTESSSTTVYERRNIQQVTVSNQMGETTVETTEWTYEQQEYTAAEYAGMNSPETQTSCRPFLAWNCPWQSCPWAGFNERRLP